jgi:chemosensory pili system protein ChpA (sensor histidine kinase/response regulator)
MKENNLFSRILRNFNLSGTGAATLERQARDPRSAQALVPGQPDRPGKPTKKILVVDDDLIIQRTLMHALEQNGYQVFTAGDVSMALGLVRQEKPDLILLDLTFPFNPTDMGGPLQDGFFVIEWLRRAAGGNPIPIMIISGNDPAQHKAQISATDIIAYFRKPLDHHKLLVAVHSVFGKSRW